MRRKLSLLTVILMGISLFYFSCEEKGVKRVTAGELIKKGWLKFEAGNLVGAGSDFSAALSISTNASDSSGAFLGLGWAQLRQSQGGLAENSFVEYLDFSPGLPELNDGRAGLASAYGTQSKFRPAIDTANVVLASDSTWKFGHDNSINYIYLHLQLAQWYYLDADFSSSLDQVKSYLVPIYDPGWDLDTTQIDNWRDMLDDEIEFLYKKIVGG